MSAKYEILNDCNYDFLKGLQFPLVVHGEHYNEYLSLVHTNELLRVGAHESVTRKGMSHKWSFLNGKEIRGL